MSNRTWIRFTKLSNCHSKQIYLINNKFISLQIRMQRDEICYFYKKHFKTETYNDNIERNEFSKFEN